MYGKLFLLREVYFLSIFSFICIWPMILYFKIKQESVFALYLLPFSYLYTTTCWYATLLYTQFLRFFLACPGNIAISNGMTQIVVSHLIQAKSVQLILRVQLSNILSRFISKSQKSIVNNQLSYYIFLKTTKSKNVLNISEGIEYMESINW